MAKRFTDTEKWKDDWYISLSNDYKIIWQWLLDNCSHAGVCKRSIGLLNLMCRTQITENDLIKEMDGRVIIVGNHWFIPKFLKFQYSTLKSKKPAIVSVVKELAEKNIINLIPKSFGNDYIIITQSLKNDSEIIKDMDKVKDMDKEEKGGMGEKEGGYSFTASIFFSLENMNKSELWQQVKEKVCRETGKSPINDRQYLIEAAKDHALKLEEKGEWQKGITPSKFAAGLSRSIKNGWFKQNTNKDGNTKLGTSAARVEALKNWGFTANFGRNDPEADAEGWDQAQQFT